MDELCYRMTKVASGKLSIRSDRSSMLTWSEEKMIDLMMSYNPVWLRFSFETVFGEIIPMRSSSLRDAGSSVLKRFLLNRFLKDPTLKAVFVHEGRSFWKGIR